MNYSMIRKAAVACILAVIQSAALIPSIHAENWPQILGLNRDGVVAELRVVQGWPTGEPTIHWRYPVGDGYAGPAVIDNQILVFHRIGAKERIESIARDTGKSLWRRDFDAYYRSSLDPDSGPRCVPLVVDDRVVVFGAAGACHAVKLHGGEQLWSRDLAEQYDSPDGYFGAGSTPVHVNGIVVINLGGEKNNAGMVGLDIATGQTVWANTSELASYSSPIVVKHEGKDRVFAVTRFNGILLDPTTGEVLMTTPFGKRGPTVNAATPLSFDDRVFITASYGVGAELLQIGPNVFRKLWENDDSLSSQYSTPVFSRSHFYGIHGREDMGVSELRCIDADNGRVMWRMEGFGVANLLLAEQTIIAVTAGGELVLVNATPTKYAEQARVRFSENVVRALPAVSKDRLYVRDSKELFSIQIGR